MAILSPLASRALVDGERRARDAKRIYHIVIAGERVSCPGARRLGPPIAGDGERPVENLCLPGKCLLNLARSGVYRRRSPAPTLA